MLRVDVQPCPGEIEKAVELVQEVIVLNKTEPATYDVISGGVVPERGQILGLFKTPYFKV